MSPVDSLYKNKEVLTTERKWFKKNKNGNEKEGTLEYQEEYNKQKYV